MYGISEKVYNDLLEYFIKNPYINKVILFGSRAKGNYRYNSDIDLCIDCQKTKKIEIFDSIDEIVGIYSFDILYTDSLNAEVEEQINKYGVLIYNKDL